jgi:hypothetical protein
LIGGKKQIIIDDMKVVNKLTPWIYILFLFLAAWWAVKDIEGGFQITILVIGELFVMYSSIELYKKLKVVRFRIRYVPQRAWLIFLIINAITWPIFYFLFAKERFMLAYLFPSIILPLLLIIDIIATIGRKIFK